MKYQMLAKPKIHYTVRTAKLRWVRILHEYHECFVRVTHPDSCRSLDALFFNFLFNLAYPI